MTTLQEMAIIMRRLSDAYSTGVNAQQARAYHLALQDVDRLVLARAAHMATMTLKWFPKPSELRSLAENRSSWKPPRDPFDEACMWVCYARDVDPDQLTPADIEAAYATTQDHR